MDIQSIIWTDGEAVESHVILQGISIGKRLAAASAKARVCRLKVHCQRRAIMGAIEQLRRAGVNGAAGLE